MTLISLSKGVEKKLVRRGKNNFGLHARKFPLRDFPPPGHDFCPRLGIPFQFFLFMSLGWPSLQGGNFPPEKLSQGNFPLPTPSSTPMCIYIYFFFLNFIAKYQYLDHKNLKCTLDDPLDRQIP